MLFEGLPLRSPFVIIRMFFVRFRHPASKVLFKHHKRPSLLIVSGIFHDDNEAIKQKPQGIEGST